MRASVLEAEQAARAIAYESTTREVCADVYGIPRVEREHVSHIATDAARANVGLIDRHTAALADGDFELAAQIVREALEGLHRADPLLFKRSPLREHVALLMKMWAEIVSPKGQREMRTDTTAYYRTNTFECTNEERRVLAYRFRTRILAEGLELPAEDEYLGEPPTCGDTPSAINERKRREARA